MNINKMKNITSDNGIQTTKKWYEENPKAEAPSKHSKSEMDVMNLKEEAKKCLDSESTAYHMKQSKSHNSEYSWLKTAFSKGTISDKVAAGIVLVQNSPKHNLNHLQSLISQVKVAKHNQCGMVIAALRDLFLTDLLHPNHKLLKFEEQNLDQLDDYSKSFEADESGNFKNRPVLSRNKLLANWYFEDQLKEIYEKFVTSLSAIANDTVDTNREKAVGVMNDLLMGNAEQEHKLLDFLINKIGDPGSKVASKAVFSLTKLLHEHPNMKIIVLGEVEKLLFRTNISPRAQYFAICLLTQFLLSKEDTEVANSLINLYFAFFKACLKKGEPDSRMMAAILTGVNRAYPFADGNSIKLNEHIDSVYKVVHVGSFNVSLNALSLLFQVVGKNPEQSDRFYSAFYRKLLDPQIGTANKRAIFLNLLFRVLRNDQSVIRQHAFIKRVLQVSNYYPANMACATLYVVSQILTSKKNGNKLLIKSGEIVKNEDTEENPTEKSNENYEENENKKKKKKKDKNNKEDTIILSNVVNEPVVEITEIKDNEVVEEEKIIVVKKEFNATHYDPFARNPLHSGANLSFYSELSALSLHFHPSVALFAKNIIEGKPINYTGDPLEDLSLIRFLDRYVFKNPKKLDSKKVVRKNDPLAQRAAYTPTGVRCIPVDSMAYLNEREDRIPVDELFLYHYLHNRKAVKGVKDEDEDDDLESVNSEDFNEMLDGLTKSKDIDDLDIAGDFNARPKKSKGGKGSDNDEASEEEKDSDLEGPEFDDNDDDDDDELDAEIDGIDDDNEEDVDLEDLDDMDLDDVDDDFSDMEFNDDDDDLEETSSSKRKHNKKDNKFSKKFKGDIDENTFVSAEEFAEMLEKQGHTKFKHGASKSFSDRDGASAKQLDWETERNQRIKGYRGKNKSENKFKSKKSFSKHQKPMKRRKK